MKRLWALALLFAMASLASTAEGAPPIEDYGKLAAVEMVELSPDGSKLAYVGGVNGERSIVVLQVGGEVLAATTLKEQAAAGLQWASDDILLLRTDRSIKGVDLGVAAGHGSWLLQPPAVVELTAIDVKRRTSLPLAETKTMRFAPGNGPLPVREIGGRLYAFLAGRPISAKAGEPLDLYRVDLQTGDAVKVAESAGAQPSWAVRPDGSVAASAGQDLSTKSWSLRAAAAGKPVVRSKAYGGLQIYGFGRTADTLVVGPDRRNASTFMLVKADDGATEPLQEPRLQRLWFDRGTFQLIGYTAGADRMKVILYDPRLQAKVQSAYKAFPGYFPVLVSASADFDRMVIQTTGDDDPGTFWLVDMTTGKAKSLGMSAPIGGKDVAVPSLFDYVATDGLAMHGVLTLPRGSNGKNMPVVIMPVGAGGQRASLDFDWWAQAFASRGYAVFQPNPRGVTGYGNAFHEAGFGELADKMLSDVSAGVRALAAAGVIDPSRTCLVGVDMGGYSALGVLAKEKLPARCAVAYAAPSDLKDSFVDDYWQDMVFKPAPLYPVTKLAAMEEVSPVTYQANINAPVMLIHPKDDANVPVSQSRALANILKRAGKPVELIELDGADHWLNNPATRTATLKASVAFVERYNPVN